MQPPQPIERDLVLLGGGHTHAIVLRKFGMQPIAGLRLTLITNLVDTPYSGMLPCHISGLYNFDESHIDLRPLTRFANCRLLMDEAISLDLANQQVLCKAHPPIAYDALSIDIGSTPATVNVPGAADYVIPAKPVPQLLQQWWQWLAEIETDPAQPRVLGIVGGGVGGVEIALNMQARLWQALEQAGQPRDRVAIHLFHRGEAVATGRNRWTQKHLAHLFQQRGIHLHLQESVTAIEPLPHDQRQVRCKSGLAVACDRVIWVTSASAAPWIRESGLATNEKGFIQTHDTLQTLRHPNVFAVGDIATMVNHPRPKAGVFAVRQGPPLFKNLQRWLTGQPLKPFRPQKQFLNIIDTGMGTAIASRGPLAAESRLFRWWKDRIDRKFMRLFTDFPDMAQRAAPSSLSATRPAPMPCAGCASKVGGDVLSQALRRLQQDFPDAADWPAAADVVVGLAHPDDAAVLRVPTGQLLVQTVDYFRALLDDPYVFGQICVNHCLSDLFAMGAVPQSVLAIATLPYGTTVKQAETLYLLLAGAYTALAQSKTPLIGGHTTEGPDLALGFTCNGLVEPDRLLRKGNAQVGDSLILTKAVGTGTLFAADMQLQAKGRWIEAAVDSMRQSNYQAAQCLLQQGATACTDVTGFGLVGHLLEMLQASQVGAELDLTVLPVLLGARETLASGIVSSLQPQNAKAVLAIQNQRAISHQPDYPLLFDPQTSGGLLAAVPAAKAEAAIAALQALGYTHTCKIGTITTASSSAQPITIKGW
ncbi:selenide, water dikinase SelD [Sphaerothrix gracilis]|uniref:selenide, water dikinase SelD n=1 Tax=Sphaerothrix gracilis TaxID=3151835 RepID=UPI0031FDD8F1